MKEDKRVGALLPFFIVIFFFTFQYNGIAFADAPVISKIESKDLVYKKGSGKEPITNSLDITDNDNRFLRSAVVRITGNFNMTEDVLDVRESRGIVANWNSASGILNLSGISSLSDYEMTLRSVTFANINNSNPSAGTRTVTFTVNDGTFNSNEVSRNIIIGSSGPGLTPTATISGSDTICQGENGKLQVALTGISPWSFKVLLNNAELTELKNIQNKNYVLTVSQPGTYTITSVKDALFQGTSSGEGLIVLHQGPTANISGTATICDETTATIQVDLTGTSPWNFSYRANEGIPIAVQNVIATPKQLDVHSAGTYTLVNVTDKYCNGTVSGSAVINFTTVPNVSISGLLPSYSNKSSEWVPMTGNPSGGEFSGKGVLFYNNIWYFLPGLAPVGTNDIVYAYRSSPASCYGYDTVVVRIFESSAEILFENDRTKFCVGDPPFSVKGINLLNDSYGNFSINGNVGLTDHGDNTATVDPSKLGINHYTITYSSDDGTTVDRDFEVGNALLADFTWNNECFQTGQSIAFTNTSSSPFGYLADDSYHWKITGKNDSVSYTESNIAHSFPEPGNYQVNLEIHNSYGCAASKTVTFPLRPVINLANENYFENFEGSSGWKVESSSQNAQNSWQLGTPAKQGFPLHGFSGSYSGEKSWYTNLNTTPAPEETSYLTSPCFDFSGTIKPTFVAHIWRLFSDNRDGSNFQYSTNNGRNWSPLGIINDGINWFNGYFGTPGDQAMGWTAIKDASWMETRHALDFLNGEPRVQFRFAYKAFGSALGNDGIAVDDIRIMERNRTLLIEHFTNSSDPLSATADSMLNNIVDQSGANILDVQYHASGSSDDPFNADNPVIPNSRQFYYSLSDVPYAVINGGTTNYQRIDYESRKLDENQMIVQSLFDSNFKIKVHSMVEDNTLYTEVIVSALQALPLTELSVRQVVIEPLIDQVTGENGETVFRNVVRDMLPDAAGSNIFRAWNKDDSITIRENWPIEHVYDKDHLSVVAFIQNEETKEIYQAALDTRSILTANEDPHMKNQSDFFTVYPNPAHQLLNVVFGEETKGNMVLELINSTGQLVCSAVLPGGIHKHEMAVDKLPEGIYLLRITSGEQIKESSKILITH